MRVARIVLLVSASAAFPAMADPPPPADLGSMLAEIDAANPELLAGQARVRGAAEAPQRAQALPDPKLSVSYTNDSLDQLTLGSSEFSNLTVGWEQEVPTKSVRNAASGAASADAELARLSVETLRSRLRARVIALYADLVRIDATTELLDESRELMTAQLGVARARYESGLGMQEGLLRAQAGRRRLDIALDDAARARRGIELSLNQALGRHHDVAIGHAATLPGGTLPADASSWDDALARGSPVVQEATGRTSRAEAAVTEAKATGKAEFSWLAAYQFRGGLDPMVVGGFGVRLPVWKNRSLVHRVAQSEAELEASRHDAEAELLRVWTELQTAVNDVVSAERRLVLYREALIPEDTAALDAARAEFSAGKAEMGVVLDAIERRLVDRRESIALAAGRVQTLAVLETMTGKPLLDTTGPGDTP